MKDKKHAPLTKAELTQLRTDSLNIKAAAARKGTTLDQYDIQRESAAAKHHFTLGCWLYFYRRMIFQCDEQGFNARVDCAWRLFSEDMDNPNPGYRFFTIFDFGERQFDTLVEMGDADLVIDALRERYLKTPNPNVKSAFVRMGWSLEKKHPQLELI